MQNISGFGAQVVIRASETFPNGITLTQFADDADPFDSPNITVAETAMGLNGDLVTWNTAVPIPITLNLVPGSDDDINMAVLLEANRVGRGKLAVRDEITCTVIYPDGKSVIYQGGQMVEGMPSDSISSAGRKKSKPYTFHFENKTS